MKILKEIKKIQQRFLWVAKEDKRYIHWVGWGKICKPIQLGELGVKRICELKLALLYKWKCRILEEKQSL